MKIVMLGPFGLHPKGTMRARALPAARALSRRGHHVTIVMPPWHTPVEAGRAWLDECSSVELEYVILRGLAVPLVGHLAIALRMAKRAVEMAPHVVHAFKPKAYSGLSAAMLWALQRVRRRHALLIDTDDWEGLGGWNELAPYGRAQRWAFAWQERWGLAHADAVTVASRALEGLVWSLGVPRARVHYLPNAVEVADQDAARTSAPASSATRRDRSRDDGGEQDRECTLLLYTRFFEFDLARPLDVLHIVRHDWPQARLLVVGKGLAGEEREFLALARSRGLGQNVKYRGWLEGDELAAALRSADVALYPFDDTLVNRTKSAVKLLDLLASGVPVVAEAVGENREIVEDGRSGLLVPTGDPAAFAAAVGRVLADSTLRETIARGARQRVRQRYTWASRAADLEALYELAGGGKEWR